MNDYGPRISSCGSQATLPKDQLLRGTPTIIRSLVSAQRYLRIPQDPYFPIHSAFKPTSKDIKGFAEVLDANKDGQVTLADIEAVAVQFLCGPGVLSPHSLDHSYKKGKY